MMSIVTTGPDTGYYADVFRSRKERGGEGIKCMITSIITSDSQ